MRKRNKLRNGGHFEVSKATPNHRLTPKNDMQIETEQQLISPSLSKIPKCFYNTVSEAATSSPAPLVSIRKGQNLVSKNASDFIFRKCLLIVIGDSCFYF